MQRGFLDDEVMGLRYVGHDDLPSSCDHEGRGVFVECVKKSIVVDRQSRSTEDGRLHRLGRQKYLNTHEIPQRIHSLGSCGPRKARKLAPTYPTYLGQLAGVASYGQCPLTAAHYD